MTSLKDLGFKEYYCIDNYMIYNTKTKRYLKENKNYKYKLKNNEEKYKWITVKEIYKKLFNKVFCIDNIILLENENFKEIKDTNGNYEVSNLGRIKSKANNNAIILKPQITKKGYQRIQLSIEGKRYSRLVHCLVAEAWLNPPKSLEYEIHHIDKNKLNNKVSNLQYLSKIDHCKLHEEERKKVENGTKSKKDNNRKI